MFMPLGCWLLAAWSIVQVARAQAAGPADLSGVSLTQLAYGGSGCPSGALKFAELVSPWSFMSIVDGYTAAVGSNASVTDNHKVCQINININYPANLQYTIVNNTYSGYLNLGYGVNGTHNTTVSWGGTEKSYADVFQGTLSEKFTVLKATHLETTDLWSPCGSPAPLILQVSNNDDLDEED
ncbi:hypothetical protein EG329_001933 [Mollisiaceae sp. DMI_Dod_QoI]|nr:hypothetical protein EG329_001933 [Helotiales sp. DMI_Dod_QoI]